MNTMHLTLHGLAIKKHGNAKDISGLIGLDEKVAGEMLVKASQTGRAQETDGKYVLTPLARVSLESSYSGYFSDVRDSENFMAAYESFEEINIQIKTIITDWQTMEVGGKRVANDHIDTAYDNKIIDRLGNCHDRAEAIFFRLEKDVPRLAYYRTHLLEALEKAEDGAIEWVSDAQIDSYHTLWFELHEDLLRIAGRTRQE